MESNFLELTKQALDLINIEGDIVEVVPFGGGLINATFLVRTKLEGGEERKYILQRINHYIFKEVEKLMDNYCRVCDYLKDIVAKNNGDIERDNNSGKC